MDDSEFSGRVEAVLNLTVDEHLQIAAETHASQYIDPHGASTYFGTINTHLLWAIAKQGQQGRDGDG